MLHHTSNVCVELTQLCCHLNAHHLPLLLRCPRMGTPAPSFLPPALPLFLSARLSVCLCFSVIVPHCGLACKRQEVRTFYSKQSFNHLICKCLQKRRQFHVWDGGGWKRRSPGFPLPSPDGLLHCRPAAGAAHRLQGEESQVTS